MASSAIPNTFLEFVDEKIQDGNKKVGVDWRNMNFFGPNNMIKQNLNYLIDVVAPFVGRLVLSTDNEQRYSVPWNQVDNRGGDSTMRLDMLGVKLFNPPYDAFGFQLCDVTDPTNILLDTIN